MFKLMGQSLAQRLFFFPRVFSLLQLFEVSGQRQRVCRVGCSLSYLLSDPQREGNDSHSDPHVCN